MNTDELEILDKEYPTSFLETLFEHNQRIVHVKIQALDWQERVLREIQGIVRNGTYGADGSSNVRRNLSLTFSTRDRENVKIISYLTPGVKINLFIGLENLTTMYREDKIIWFPMGIFVLTEPTLSHTTESTQLTISAQDKMSMLNGTLGGKLTTPISFTQRVNGTTVSMPWREIFLNTAILFGNEDPAKVVVDSVPDYIQEYTQVKSVGGLKDTFIHVNAPAQVDGERIITRAWSPTIPETEIKFSKNERLYKLRRFGPLDPIASNSSNIEPYMKDVGETVTSVFDDIVEALSNTHEYFYTRKGDLIFQPIPNYINQTFDPDEDEGLGYFSYELNMEDFIPNYLGLPFTYDFSNKKTITRYDNNPTYTNIKNDFVVTSSTGQILEIAIDDRPEIREIKEWFIGVAKDFNAASPQMSFIQKDGVQREPYNPLTNTVPFEFREAIKGKNPVYVDVPLDKIPWQVALGLKNYYIRNIYGGASPWILPRWGQECESMIFKYTASADKTSYNPNTGIFNPANIYIGEPWLAGYPISQSASTETETEQLDYSNPIFTAIGDPAFWSYYLDLIDTKTALGKYSIALIGKRQETAHSEMATTLFRTNPTEMVVVTETELAELGGDSILDDLKAQSQAYAVIKDINDQLFLPDALTGEDKGRVPYVNITGDPTKLQELKYAYQFTGGGFSINVGGKFEGSFLTNEDGVGNEKDANIFITNYTYKHPVTKVTYTQTTTSQIRAPWYYQNEDSNKDDFTEYAFLAFILNKNSRCPGSGSSNHFALIKHNDKGQWFYGQGNKWTQFTFDANTDVIVAVAEQTVYKGEYTFGSHRIDVFNDLFNIRDSKLGDMFTVDGAVDCFSTIRNLIYQRTNTADVITLSVLPVYSLEPNTLIYVEDEETEIMGMYMITGYTINLNTQGTPLMNITAVKANPRI